MTSKKDLEIELRFLVDRPPDDLESYERHELQDAYPFITRAKYLRARRSDDKYTLTFKKGEGLVRIERQIPIDRETFELLWRETDERWHAERTRYIIPYKGKEIELNVFHGLFEGLVIAEVELDSEQEKVELPEWIGEDITNNKRITNHITNAEYVIGLVRKRKLEAAERRGLPQP